MSAARMNAGSIVIPKPGRHPSEAEVKQFALRNAPAYAHPRFVWFVNTFPLASTNKLDRGALRACMNLSYLLALAGRVAESQDVVEHGLALARRRGDRVWERSLMTT